MSLQRVLTTNIDKTELTNIVTGMKKVKSMLKKGASGASSFTSNVPLTFNTQQSLAPKIEENKDLNDYILNKINEKIAPLQS